MYCGGGGGFASFSRKYNICARITAITPVSAVFRPLNNLKRIHVRTLSFSHTHTHTLTHTYMCTSIRLFAINYPSHNPLLLGRYYIYLEYNSESVVTPFRCVLPPATRRSQTIFERLALSLPSLSKETLVAHVGYHGARHERWCAPFVRGEDRGSREKREIVYPRDGE